MAGVPLGIEGCAANASDGDDSVAPRSESVVVDFYSGADRTATCSGTLIASNVVLTAAHCADQSTSARVTAPHASAQQAAVSRVFVYDWTSSDPKMKHNLRNDLALLVLRTPIHLSQYAKIQAGGCRSCSVVQTGRSRQPGGFSADARFGQPTRIAPHVPAGHPLDLFSAQSMEDSGGAVYRLNGTVTGNVVGVTVGRGVTTRGGYIAMLNNPDLQQWLRAIVRAASRPPASKTAPSHTQDDLGDGSDYSDGLDDTSGGDYSDPIDTSSGDTTTDDTTTDDTTTDDTSTDGTGGDTGFGGDTGMGGDDGFGGDWGEAGDTGMGGDDGFGGDWGDGGDSGASGDNGVGGDESGGSAGDGAGGDGSGGSAGDGSDSKNADAPKKPEKVDETGKQNSSNKQSSPSKSPSSPQSKPPSAPSSSSQPSSPPQPPPQQYAPPKIVYAPNGATGKWVSVNAYVAAAPGDTSFDAVPAYAAMLAPQGAGVYAAHGAPDQLVAPHDPSVPVALLGNGRPLVMAVSFSGAAGANAAPSTAALFAQEGSAPSTKVYGCTSYVFRFKSMVGCSGQWVDGGFMSLGSTVRHNLGLSTCAPKINSKGQQTATEADCVLP